MTSAADRSPVAVGSKAMSNEHSSPVASVALLQASASSGNSSAAGPSTPIETTSTGSSPRASRVYVRQPDDSPVVTLPKNRSVCGVESTACGITEFTRTRPTSGPMLLSHHCSNVAANATGSPEPSRSSCWIVNEPIIEAPQPFELALIRIAGVMGV